MFMENRVAFNCGTAGEEGIFCRRMHELFILAAALLGIY